MKTKLVSGLRDWSGIWG